MIYHLFQFKDYPNFHNSIHDLLNIHFKNDCDFIYHYDQSVDDACKFIQSNLNNPNVGLVLYCQSIWCEKDGELLRYIRTYDNLDKINIKIVFFGFDWCFRGDDNWVNYCRNLYTAKHHYVVTPAPNLEHLERVHNSSYKEYESHIIFYNFWSCYQTSFQDFNHHPIVKIALSGNTESTYPERNLLHKKIINGDSRFIQLEYDNTDFNDPQSDTSKFTKKLSNFLCCFTSSPHFYQHNLHLIVLKYYEILASGSLLLCPVTEEPYLKNIGLIAGTHYIACEMHRIDYIANYILDQKNRKIIDSIRFSGHEFAKNNLNSYQIYLELKKKFNNLFGHNKSFYKYNTIDSDVIIHQNVSIGKGNIIKSGTIIHENTIIGDNNIILEGNQIGTLPVTCNLNYSDLINNNNNGYGGVIIGNNNFFHINNIISSGQTDITRIGHHNKFMSQVYISHDNIIHNHVTFYPRVFSSGLVEFFNYASIGAGAYIQQHCKIGGYCMVGMNGVATKSVLPFMVCINNKYHRLNMKKLSDFDKDHIAKFEQILQALKNGKPYDHILEDLPIPYYYYFYFIKSI